MRKVYNWTAKRAGGRITVYGESLGREAIRIAGVDSITVERADPTDPFTVVATVKTGERVELATLAA